MRKCFLPVLLALVLILGAAQPVSAARFFGITLPPLHQVKQVRAQDVEPPKQEPKEPPKEEQQFKEEEEPRDVVDPREIQGVLRETRDQLQNINRLTSNAQRSKLAKELEELAQLKDKVLSFQTQFKQLKPDSENAREIIETYRDEQLWDTINDIRRRVELPKELAEIAKRVKEAEKLLNTKQVQKTFTELGGDVAKLQAIVASMKGAHAAATKAMQEGNVEDADEALMDIREGGHPGELTGILHGMRGFGGQLRSIRDTEIRDGIKEIVRPIIEALNDGDIREARMTIDELGREIEQLMRKAVRIVKKDRSRFIDGIQKLEQRINEKLQAEELKNEKKPPEGNE